MQEISGIRYMVTVEFVYNWRPARQDETTYRVMKRNFDVFENFEKAEKEYGDLIEKIRAAGYDVVSKTTDGYDSKVFSTLLRAPGTECRVHMSTTTVSSVDQLAGLAAECAAYGRGYVKWMKEQQE